MMDSSIAIHAEQVSKLFYINKSGSNYPTLRELFQSIFNAHAPSKKVKLWALKDVSFTINRQDRIAILGLNGAGKSTLLKILSRVLVPTEGRIRINGRVSSLLELGTGFHPDLSGRDNIYLNGSILGMSRQETRAVYEDILAFSEIEKFIDTPIKFYSSGMQARLGFAVAAYLNSDILIVDEVLSVGDFAFQQKCLKRMREICQSGKTIIFVSHGLETVKTLCNRGILLVGGQMRGIGNIDTIAEQYLQISKKQVVSKLSWQGSVGTDEFQVKSCAIQVANNSDKIEQHTPLILAVEFETFEKIEHLVVGAEIMNHNEHTIAASYHSLSDTSHATILEVGIHRMQLKFDFSLFTGGNYTIAFLASAENGVSLVHRDPKIQFFVDDGLEPISNQIRTAVPAGLACPQGWKWGLVG